MFVYACVNVCVRVCVWCVRVCFNYRFIDLLTDTPTDSLTYGRAIWQRRTAVQNSKAANRCTTWQPRTAVDSINKQACEQIQCTIQCSTHRSLFPPVAHTFNVPSKSLRANSMQNPHREDVLTPREQTKRSRKPSRTNSHCRPPGPLD